MSSLVKTELNWSLRISAFLLFSEMSTPFFLRAGIPVESLFRFLMNDQKFFLDSRQYSLTYLLYAFLVSLCVSLLSCLKRSKFSTLLLLRALLNARCLRLRSLLTLGVSQGVLFWFVTFFVGMCVSMICLSRLLKRFQRFSTESTGSSFRNMLLKFFRSHLIFYYPTDVWACRCYRKATYFDYRIHFSCQLQRHEWLYYITFRLTVYNCIKSRMVLRLK